MSVEVLKNNAPSTLSSVPSKVSAIPQAASAPPDYEIPYWAGKPPNGSHLDVVKGEQLIQKLMVDEKKAYFFGRNPKQCDFVVEHASCSRVHAVLVYHKVLQRFALVDLNSCHGTFVGKVRIEPMQPVFMEIAAVFHFGASTRRYILRAKLEVAHDDDESKDMLPEEHELENLTEYNTALNRRIPVIPISLEDARRKKRARGNVAFIEEETIINPEDIDPTIGRFRNLVATAIISTKRKAPLSEEENPHDSKEGVTQKKILRPGRVDDYKNTRYAHPMVSSLSIVMNSAPDLDLYAKSLPEPTSGHIGPFIQGHKIHDEDDGDAPHKKKYAKESWPGRKPGQSRVLA